MEELTNEASISIQTQDLGKRFNREWIFRKLTFTFRPGTTYAITGPNGSGKSTLLQVLWGQMPPSAGALKYHRAGNEVAGDDIFKHIAIAAPYMDLIEEFTLQEQLAFHFKLKSPRNNFSIDDIVAKMYLNDARHKPIGNFSSGMRQRVKLALAFFTQSDIIFFDEPGTNLDKQAFAWYKQQLAELPHDNLVFIASNNPEEYPQNAHTINILDLKKNG